MKVLALYCTEGLPEVLASPAERDQRRRGLMLFADFMSDPVLGRVDGEMLRRFRAQVLPNIPARANALPKRFKRASMRETIAALDADEEGRTWERLKPDMQAERMQWLARYFGWMHQKKHMLDDPASGLRGESGMTKAERNKRRRDKLDDDARGPFERDELVRIFSQPTFRTGSGTHIIKKNERWRPFEFWLPLLGLFAGLRIKEASQLWLDDVVQEGGVWCFDINDATDDKSLKTDASWRFVPLHPILIEAGFIKWCDALRAQGFRRAFPELSHVKTDARYAKESSRRMSSMLEKLGWPRNGTKVYHCFRHNLTNKLMRVPAHALPESLSGELQMIARHRMVGHDLPDGASVNQSNYAKVTMAERAQFIAAVAYEGLPAIAPFDVEAGLRAVFVSLNDKKLERQGKEDLGPLGFNQSFVPLQVAAA